MALQKTYINASGVTGNYWRIVSFNEDKRKGTVSVSMFLYINKAHRLDNKAPIFRKEFTISSFLADDKTHIGKAYEVLGENDFFDGATNV